MHEYADVDGIILASGLSRRMGTNKLLLDFGGVPLLQRMLEGFPYAAFSRVLLVAADHRVISIASRYPVTICQNHFPEKGQSIAIRLGVEASSASGGYLFMVADQPLLRVSTIRRLLETFALNQQRIVMPLACGKRRNPVVFPAEFGGALQNLTGDNGGKQVIDDNSGRTLYVEFDSDKQFGDIDTPEAYAEMLASWQIIENRKTEEQEMDSE